MPCYHPKVKTLGFPARNFIKISHAIKRHTWLISGYFSLLKQERFCIRDFLDKACEYCE